MPRHDDLRSKSWRPWILEHDEAKPFLKRALDVGINFLDTADATPWAAASNCWDASSRDGRQSDNLVIATKVYQPMSDDVNDRGLSRKHILMSIDRSLKRLQMDHVDLYQIHRWTTRRRSRRP